MAGRISKKKTTSKSKKSSGSGSGKTNLSGQGETRGLYGEIVVLGALTLCLLMLIGNFGMGGIAGSAVSSVLFGIFGLTAYLIPILLFGMVAFLVSNRGNAHAYFKTVASLVFLCMVCTMLELVTNGYSKETSLTVYYAQASSHKNAGGLVGGLFVKMLCPLLGIAGAYVVVFALLLISLILITEKSFFSVVKKGGSKAREDSKMRKQSRDARSKAKKERREEKIEQTKQAEQEEKEQGRRIQGVSFDTTLVGKSPNVRELQAEEATAEDLQKTVPSLFEEKETVQADDVSAEQKKPQRKERSQQTTSPQDLQQEMKMVEEQIRDAGIKADEQYAKPSLSLLTRGKAVGGDSKAYLRETALKLEQTLQNFGVHAHVVDVSCGPSVTRYEIQPEQGVKVSKIVGLSDDLKLNLAVSDLRIEAPIPGKAAVGIEVPNKENTLVMLRDLLESREFQENTSKIAFAVGKDISGKTVISDIAKMPHLLVAGATGSGKSVCINTLIISILYKASPEEVKMIMIDPKVVELSVYNGIPHLLIPVVTDPKKASGALNWAVAEMMKRYQLFAEYNVRDIKAFNVKLDKLKKEGEQENLPQKMPQVVIIVDELADLMMVAPSEVEGAICRLAQLARAAGMHLVLATQRPSVNVITGLIKANMPSRIAFSTTSGIDSRTIIDMNGAEKLLGKGDMLFYPAGYPKPVRVQGSFVSDQEVQKVVNYLIEQNGNATYNEEIEEHVNSNMSTDTTLPGIEDPADERDTYFTEAGKLIIEKEKASIGMLQRMFKIGFNRAARIMDQLAEAGVVGGEEGTKPRKILMTMEEFEKYLQEGKV